MTGCPSPRPRRLEMLPRGYPEDPRNAIPARTKSVRVQLRTGATRWHLGTRTKLQWITLGSPGWRGLPGAAIPGMSGWLGPIPQAQAGVEARRVPGTQGPPLPLSSPTSLKGITYIQSYYRCRRLAAGREGQSLPIFYSATTVSILRVQTHPSATLLFAEICPCLLTELFMGVGKLQPARAGHQFG